MRGAAYRGEASTYEVELASGKVLRVTQVNAARQAQPYAAGETVSLAFAPAAAPSLSGSSLPFLQNCWLIGFGIT